jgi:hypothetical protein
VSSLGVLSGPNASVRRSALGEEKKVFTTAGRQYWIDLFKTSVKGDGRDMFADWVAAANREFPGSVKLLLSEEGDDPIPWQWVKFQTDMSLPWTLAQNVGLPTPIKEGQKINSRADTGTAQDVINRIEKEAAEDRDRWLTYAKWGLVIAGIATAAHLLGNAAKVGTLVKEASK